MKYLKTYEKINEPQVGDYVICDEKMYDKVNIFLNNNVGQLISRDPDEYGFKDEYDYIVKYENVPLDIKDYFLSNVRSFGREEIIEFSSNKEDLEAILDANKYNI